MKRFIALLILPLFISAATFEAYDARDEITWYSLEEAQQLAKKHDKKVLVYAEAVWCTYCKKMEKEVFPKQEVIQSMAEYYYPVRVDIESDKKMKFNEETITGSQFAQKYRVRGTPTTFFINKEGQILGAQPGFIPAETFITLLKFVGSGAHQDQSFDEYAAQNKND